ncbi:FAD-dependent oxidoreductase [Skermanella stibiiresistens SB22]|uniref:FAD-dependent oxidoreductase n=1 Tax=Skermanella stibiiresistens SB22 TaxID=1385369 RepID=W9H477_9PROT|nr:TIGR03364 family FAD-dependent oxidoreductase [Skermanella stibiiresistens]EWY41020.1 FAD-dependent oxidoreductase [Skermanella stibiiresistens SB22]
MAHYDLAVIGGGIVGLSHALAAARRGLRVCVIDRERRSNGASIRNFGFVTVTGQRAGVTWRRAMRSRDIWAEVAPQAGIPVLHRGTAVIAHRPEAMSVLEQFAAGTMGADCRLLDPAEVARAMPVVRPGIQGALWSPHELRVEPREALPKLATFLAAAHGVDFMWGVQARGIEPSGRAAGVDTTTGRVDASRVVVCPGGDLLTLFPETLAKRQLTLSKLHMLRLAPQPSGWTLPGSIMQDLSLVRYEGYTDLPGVPALAARLRAEAGDALDNGIHLIVVRSADGSLVVGDSHHYDQTPDPFAPAEVDDIILRHAAETLDIPNMTVTERWLGTYPSSASETAFVDNPDPAVRIAVVSSGTGMSTAFAIGEEVVADLFGDQSAA